MKVSRWGGGGGGGGGRMGLLGKRGDVGRSKMQRLTFICLGA